MKAQKKPISRSVQVKQDFSLTPNSILILCAGLSALIVYYMINSPRPYDDDNIGRYFMAQASWVKPEFFINSWGRPMAILFFVLPAQLGYWFCASATAFLTLGTMFFTYKAAQHVDKELSWMAIPLLVLQPIFLVTSYSLCSEPLAAFFFSWGISCYYEKKWIQAAVLLSLVPLGRTELTLLLPFFAAVYLKEKKYYQMLFLGLGLVLYQLAGMVMTGDALFLLTTAKSAGHGLYPNGPFDHYFKRFIFIVGPSIFALLVIGLLQDLRRKRYTILNTCLVFIFCTHVYFYWKGNVASIGFLRHFVAVAPLIALWAMEGLRDWLDPKDEEKKWILIGLALAAVITLVFYSFDLIGDYFLSDNKDYFKFLLVLGMLLLFVLRQYVNLSGLFWGRLMLGFVVLSAALYIFIKEKPLQLAPEHQTVKTFHSYYVSQFKDKNPTLMVTHPWFQFFDDFNYYIRSDEKNYPKMRKENLDSLPVGSLIAWDSHYSWRLESNVQQDDLTKDSRFKLLQQFVSPDRKFGILLFEKSKM